MRFSDTSSVTRVPKKRTSVHIFADTHRSANLCKSDYRVRACKQLTAFRDPEASFLPLPPLSRVVADVSYFSSLLGYILKLLLINYLC